MHVHQLDMLCGCEIRAVGGTCWLYTIYKVSSYTEYIITYCHNLTTTQSTIHKQLFVGIHLHVYVSDIVHTTPASTNAFSALIMYNDDWLVYLEIILSERVQPVQ